MGKVFLPAIVLVLTTGVVVFLLLRFYQLICNVAEFQRAGCLVHYRPTFSLGAIQFNHDGCPYRSGQHYEVSTVLLTALFVLYDSFSCMRDAAVAAASKESKLTDYF
jgi:hypothetical protein